ncbi:MAG: HU family DNA-binding protein [Prevotella sp.]|nr:HU family DNA-binding protein [Prevotella sp.]
MAFYKKVKKKLNGKWYPQSVLVGSSITTEQVTKRLAAESTVSPADTRAVLTALGGVLADYMAQGRSVKLDGIGSFYLTITAAKNGVDSEDKVTANQIIGTRVRFLPETRYRPGINRQATRGLIDDNIVWEEWKEKDSAAGGSIPEP